MAYCRQPARQVVISLEPDILDRLDQLVRQALAPNRSRVIEQAIVEKLERLEHTRLARECANLDPAYERALAEEGFHQVLEGWPKY
jgi:metal-responsive CopG/Arc/MetJ family transcriptional regulator